MMQIPNGTRLDNQIANPGLEVDQAVEDGRGILDLDAPVAPNRLLSIQAHFDNKALPYYQKW